ncbi:NADH dehydrogenase [ubiquinone] 1 beta subcomplex subunit 5, mitochondrial [Eupeodes corollae]|uniref:NADH dehydrogenase [ubiquinone] 1 beta subcomplex subunit 5, mitochondrial n=1 Tax=Eupeodes corollae TaxID=290404 RepID=UPI00248FBCC2|nr:NADH dehydrogenase [ubiquinone] 1 beta subcomplex subunit 5, mitochondrial [Eupeodes corollae]
MVVFSSLVRSAGAFSQYRGILNSPVAKYAIQNQLRQMSGHKFQITPSRFQWHKFKDMLHFYVMLGLIPMTAVILYANIFVGPATLTEIPEGYTPKYYETQKHPISRFIARYIFPSPQQEYEKMCHHLYEENEKAQIRELEKRVRAKMSERNDYKAYYYRPAIAKYHRISKEAADHLESLRGDN